MLSRNSPFDYLKSESAEEVKQRAQEEFNRHFVNINFYGMQTKVKNPMNSPKWKFVHPEGDPKSPQARGQDKNVISDESPYVDELSLKLQREQEQKNLISRFKTNVDSLKKDLEVGG